jgi:hypothetical protein
MIERQLMHLGNGNQLIVKKFERVVDFFDDFFWL